MVRFLAALACATLVSPPALAAQDGEASARVSFAPDTVLAPPGGPRIILLSASGEGIAALRISVPLTEGPAEAGAGRILRDLTLARLESLARPAGVRVRASRTPWGLAYTVEGAAADFEYLAYLVRQAVVAPEVNSPTFEEARLRLAEEASRGIETPRDFLTATLRRGVAKGVPPLEGTPSTVATLDAASVLDLWRRTHQSRTMTLVASVPVVPEVVLAATRGLGAPDGAPSDPLDAPPPPAGPSDIQTLRHWRGVSYSGGAAGDPLGPTAALLTADYVATVADGFEMAVELWELPDRWALTILGSAYERGTRAMERAVAEALQGARDTLTPQSVADARARVRREILLRARTPSGLVSVVGRATDASGDPLAALAYLDDLERIDADRVRAFFDELLASGPVTAEVDP